MDLPKLRERLETAQGNERYYIEKGEPENAAKWARFARYVEALIEQGQQ